jgi:hypothetical protein
VKGAPAPGRGEPPSPLGRYVYRVSYVTNDGMTYSKLFQQEPAAYIFAKRVRSEGGQPRFHRARVDRWSELPTCALCEVGFMEHGH